MATLRVNEERLLEAKALIENYLSRQTFEPDLDLAVDLIDEVLTDLGEERGEPNGDSDV